MASVGGLQSHPCHTLGPAMSFFHYLTCLGTNPWTFVLVSLVFLRLTDLGTSHPTDPFASCPLAFLSTCALMLHHQSQTDTHTPATAGKGGLVSLYKITVQIPGLWSRPFLWGHGTGLVKARTLQSAPPGFKSLPFVRTQIKEAAASIYLRHDVSIDNCHEC